MRSRAINCARHCRVTSTCAALVRPAGCQGRPPFASSAVYLGTQAQARAVRPASQQTHGLPRAIIVIARTPLSIRTRNVRPCHGDFVNQKRGLRFKKRTPQRAVHARTPLGGHFGGKKRGSPVFCFLPRAALLGLERVTASRSLAGWLSGHKYHQQHGMRTGHWTDCTVHMHARPPAHCGDTSVLSG